MDKKHQEKTTKNLSISVLALILFILFVMLSFLIARKVFLINSAVTSDVIEARASRQAKVVQSGFTSVVSATEAFSGSITSVFTMPKESQEELFKEMVRDCLGRIEFDSAWIVLEPEVLGEKTSFCFIREDGKIIEDEVLGIDDRWYFDALKSENTMVDENVSNDTLNGKQVLMTSAYSRILNPQGKPVGVAGIDIILKDLSKDLDGKSIFKDAKVSLANSKGIIMATDNEAHNIGEVHPLFNERHDLFGRPDSAGVTSFMLKDNLISLVPITYDRCGGNWTVAVETPMSSVSASSKSLIIFTVTAFSIYLIVLIISVGMIIASINRMHKEERKLGASLSEETQNLVVAAKENAATSQDQSAAVKEIVATMEDTNDLSKNIANKIEDVSSVAQKTTDDVDNGAVSLNSNLAKLHDISDANQHTINEIKTLGAEINNIWDIVTMITSVADQAKIIAFNAELEAASAGEAGKNFHIVATEVRRLADGIIDNTREIKERISGIQRSSDALILASESGNAKVEEGVAAAKELEEKFESIKNAAEITAESTKEISTIIQQQSAASGQILIALKQISTGVDNFSMATTNISSSAENIKVIAAKLNAQQEISQKGTSRK